MVVNPWCSTSTTSKISGCGSWTLNVVPNPAMPARMWTIPPAPGGRHLPCARWQVRWYEWWCPASTRSTPCARSSVSHSARRTVATSWSAHGSPFEMLETYIGRCIATTTQGVLVRSTAARLAASHAVCSTESCSVASTETCIGPYSKLYHGRATPSHGILKRVARGTPHSPPESELPRVPVPGQHRSWFPSETIQGMRRATGSICSAKCSHCAAYPTA
mmetsp:Transcript_28507/g.68069  ORF Transcript_28507/g.68069 Transcript_28507/m.68069 type:complete len:219 (+) Transcript_28507:149-805(+)